MAQSPAPPAGVLARGYERHIELSWTPASDPAVSGYEVFRSTDAGQQYTFFKKIYGNTTRNLLDWTGDEGQILTRHYQIRAVATNGQTGDFSPPAVAQTRAMSDEEMLDMVQQYTFRYFWDYGHPVCGMARERNNGNPDVVTTGGTGFGIMALIVGTERGWISRDDAVNRMIQLVSFLQIADRYHGVFPHWMDGNTGNTIPFSQYDDGADLVETAFLMQGLLAARQYFDANTPLETAVRDVITGLWEDVEWDWFRKNGSNVLYWHWSPKYAWQMNFAIRGFMEAQIVYLLAAASPTHAVPGSLYQSGWVSPGYCSSSSYYGYKPYCGNFAGGPLFFAHYSYLGFDPRGWKDACCNYFIRNRNHALIQWEYAKANPKKYSGYGENCWGLTACDGPSGYSAHDIYTTNDNGTIAPTAALASMPYTPTQSLAALRYFYSNLGQNLWGPYGFYDAFNQQVSWYADSYLAIDQGPIVAMIENYRTGLLWNLFMKNVEIKPALLACGFQPDNTVGVATAGLPGVQLSVYPNPAAAQALTVELELLQPAQVGLRVLNSTGTLAHVIATPAELPAGVHHFELQPSALPPGLYLLQVEQANTGVVTRKVLITR